MYITRNIDLDLFEWKESVNRKPLLLRGARQVGKSTAVKNLSAQFRYFVEINFDEHQSFKSIFEKDYSVQEICEQLSVLTNTPIVAGETLLFLDEIQACLPAMGRLRYFYEKMPDLHLIAAGSLLEFALAELPSFGVGRVRSLFVYPLSFREFLAAIGEHLLVKSMDQASFAKALPDAIHKKLLSCHKKFLMIGGMPEAVSAYAAGASLLDVKRILNDLLVSVQADFAKYKSRVPASRLIEVFSSVAQQTGNKFNYSYPNASLDNRQIKEALDLLLMAGLIYRVTHSSSNGIPLGAEINPKKTKYLIFDTGIFQRILGLNISDLLLLDDFDSINKGNIAELYVGLELIKSESPYQNHPLFYWQREEKNSQAEVDFVEQFGDAIIPIEVKSGKKGSMQSLYLFLKEKNLPFGIRLSIENYAEMGHVKILPLYATHMLKNINFAK